ncbi:MAG: MFS transporter [Chloroflexota bacterium]
MSQDATDRNSTHPMNFFSFLRALQNPSFALLWSGQTVSMLGDEIYGIALAWWVLEQTGSATAMSTVLICSMVPTILFLLIGGVAVDRFPRLYVIFVVDILRAIVTIAVVILAFTEQLQIWQVYVASILFGFANAFFQPAFQAIIPELVPREMLLSANALAGLSARIAGIAGPAIAAAIVALGGTAFAFALDAVTFVISTLCLLPLLHLARPPDPDSRTMSILNGLREGFATITRTPWLWISIGIFSLVNVAQSGPFSVALPFLVEKTLSAGVEVLGLIASATALGAMLTSIWVGRATRLRRRGWLAYGASIIGGVMTIAFGLPIGVAGVVMIGFVYGITMSVFNLIWTNTLQELIPREQLGRVVSVDMLGSYLLLPVGFLVAGWATELIGPATVFIGGGVLTVGLVLLGLAHPAVRALD